MLAVAAVLAIGRASGDDARRRLPAVVRRDRGDRPRRAAARAIAGGPARNDVAPGGPRGRDARSSGSPPRRSAPSRPRADQRVVVLARHRRRPGAQLRAIPLMTAIQCGAMALLLVAGLGLPAVPLALGGFTGSAWALVESSRLVEVVPWARAGRAAAGLAGCALLYYAACRRAGCGRRTAARPAAATLIADRLAAGRRCGPARGRVPAREWRRPAGRRRSTSARGMRRSSILPDGRALLVDAGGLAGTTFDIGGAGGGARRCARSGSRGCTRWCSRTVIRTTSAAPKP